jgi:hypothetical protein
VQILPSCALRLQDREGMKSVEILHSRSSFIVLQALDLVTTLVAFHFGAFEMNPLVGRLAAVLGPIGGVLFSKVVTILIVFRVRKLLWLANLLYFGVVCWNMFILLALSHAWH